MTLLNSVGLTAPAKRLIRRIGSTAVLVLAAGSPAAASEYCVICYTPDARYRCMTNDGRDGAGTDQRAWMQCISQLARGGNHESCSIDKGSTAPCLGVVKQIDLANIDGTPPIGEQGAPRPPVSGAQAPPPTATRGEPAAQPPSGGVAAAPADEPGMMEKSKENLQKAGSAIGNAAQKSWDCMSSLFKKC